MSGYDGRRRSAAVFGCVLLALGLAAADARAFELKHTAGGQVIRWEQPSVAFVVDPSVEGVVSGGGDGVSSALRAWSGVGGGPALSAAAGPEGGKPALDGKNTVLLAPRGFAPAGRALAVTVLSYVEATGAIVDADVVINGTHGFAVLAAGANAGAAPVSTDGASGDDDERTSHPFDLVHVAAHEFGHTLGLADVHEKGAVMYAFTAPGDASNRAPTTDDTDALDAAYGGSAARAGCGHSSVAGGRVRASDEWTAIALALTAGAWALSRRRALRFAPLGVALVAFLADANPARSDSTSVAVLAADATATVVASSTRDVGGVFETSLELVPVACQASACPPLARAHALGGTLGGITQQIGDSPVPRLGDRVAVVYSSLARGAAGATPLPGATLLGARP